MTAVIAERRGGKIINQQSPAIAGCVQLRRSSTDITSCCQSPPAVSQFHISPASVSHITCVVDSATSRDSLCPVNALPRQDGRLPVTSTAARSATWSLIVVAESADVPDAPRLCEPRAGVLNPGCIMHVYPQGVHEPFPVDVYPQGQPALANGE